MMFITLYISQNIKCNHKTRAQKDVFSYLEMRSDLVLGFLKVLVKPLLLSLQITTIQRCYYVLHVLVKASSEEKCVSMYIKVW